MDVGMMMLFASYGWEHIGDEQGWSEELQLARLAVESGFDVLWAAEHHFFDYAFCPDNLQLMTYLAGLYPGMHLGTAAVIVPWHDPLRVAEQIAVLDLLCQGRVRFGMGRGPARREFEAFRGTMDESRERFDEASSMIVNALRNGFMEGEGRFYKQPKVAIRPRPHYSFDGRLDAVASSEDSVASAARLGAHMVLFSDRPWPMRVPAIARYRALFQQGHGVPAPPLMSTDFCLCGPSVSEAEAHARRYMGTFVESNFHHYEFLGDHFAQVQGYDAYAQKAAIAKQSGLGGAIDGFMQAAIWDTPERILRALEARREVVGDFELNVAFRFGGVPSAIAERGLRLFAREVLPVLKTWTAVEVAEAAP